MGPSQEQDENAVLVKGTDVCGSNAENPETRSFLRGAISVFILFHLIAILCWVLPLNFAPLKDVKELTRPYMIWSGLFQSWDFFAPNPKSVNSYIEAVVITQNRTQHVWVFPRMEQLSYAKRYREERYRKFEEVLPLEQNSYAWAGVARHIAGFFKNPADPPQTVVLIQFQAPIQPGLNRGPLLTPKPKIFYEYEVNVPLGDRQ